MASLTTWSPEDFRQNAAKQLSLECDAKLLELMEQISTNIIKRTKETNTKVDEMMSNVRGTDILLDNVVNRLSSLSHFKFVENRVYEDDDNSKVTANIKNVPVKNESNEYNPVKTLNTIIGNNIKMLNNCYEKVSVLLFDSDEEEEEPVVKTIVYRPKNKYETRPIPHLIGSKEWKEKCHIGLYDSDESFSENDKEEFSDGSVDSISLPSNGPTVSESGSSVWSSNRNQPNFNKNKNHLSISSDDGEMSTTSKTSSSDIKNRKFNNTKQQQQQQPIITPIFPDPRYFIHQPKEKGLFDDSSGSDENESMNKENTIQQQPISNKSKQILNIFNDEPPELDHITDKIDENPNTKLFFNSDDDSAADSSVFNKKNNESKLSSTKNMQNLQKTTSNIKKKTVNLFDDDDFNSFMKELDKKANEKFSIEKNTDIKNLFNDDEYEDDDGDKNAQKKEIHQSTSSVENITDTITTTSKKQNENHFPTSLLENENESDIFSNEKDPKKIQFSTSISNQQKITNLFDDVQPDDDDFDNLFKSLSNKKTFKVNATSSSLFGSTNSLEIPENKDELIKTNNYDDVHIKNESNIFTKEKSIENSKENTYANNKNPISNIFFDDVPEDDETFFKQIAKTRKENENFTIEKEIVNEHSYLFDESPSDNKESDNIFAKDFDKIEEIDERDKVPSIDAAFDGDSVSSKFKTNEANDLPSNCIEIDSLDESNEEKSIIQNSIKEAKQCDNIISKSTESIDILDSLKLGTDLIISNLEKIFPTETNKNSSVDTSNRNISEIDQISNNISAKINNDSKSVTHSSYLQSIFVDTPPEDTDNLFSNCSNESEIFETLAEKPNSNYDSTIFQDDSPPDDNENNVSIVRKDEDLQSSIQKHKDFYDDFTEVIPNRNISSTATSFLFDDEPPPDNFDNIISNEIKINHEKEIKELKENNIEKMNENTENLNNQSIEKYENIGKSDSLVIEKSVSVSDLIKRASFAKENTNMDKKSIIKPQKLNRNLNINVAALMPGAKRPDFKSDDTDGNLISTFGEKLNYEPAIETVKERSSPEDHSDPKILTSFNKNRVKIPQKRRPSTKKGRIENYEKSLLFEKEVNINSSHSKGIEEDTQKKPLEKNLIFDKGNNDSVMQNSEIIDKIKDEGILNIKNLETSSNQTQRDILKENRVLNIIEKSNTSETPPPIPSFNEFDEDEDDWLVKSTKESGNHNGVQSINTKSTNNSVFDSNDEDDNLFSANISKSLNQNLQQSKKYTESNETIENVPKTSKQTVFEENYDDNEIFKKIKIYKKQPIKQNETYLKNSSETLTNEKQMNEKLKSVKSKGLFDSEDDDDDDLFGNAASGDHKKVTKRNIVKNETSIKTILSKPNNLFDDIDDDDDDIFGELKSKNKIINAQKKVQTNRGAVPKKTTLKNKEAAANIGNNPLADLLNK